MEPGQRDKDQPDASEFADLEPGLLDNVIFSGALVPWQSWSRWCSDRGARTPIRREPGGTPWRTSCRRENAGRAPCALLQRVYSR